MLLLVFLVAGLLIGLFRGGGLSGLAGLRLRAVWLVFVSAAAELSIVLLPRYCPALFPGFLPAIQLIRYLPLFLFTVLNFRKWQIWIIGIGFTMNIAVIMVNGWQMPITWQAEMTGTMQRVVDGSIPEYMLMKGYENTNLWFLADIIPVWLGETGYASIGDIVLGLGVLLTVQHGMARYSIGKHARGSLARQQGVSARHVRRTRSARKPETMPASDNPQQAEQPPTAISVPRKVKKQKIKQGNKSAQSLSDTQILEGYSEQEIAPEKPKPSAAQQVSTPDVAPLATPEPPDTINLLPLSGPYPSAREPRPAVKEQAKAQGAENADNGSSRMIPIRLSPRLETIVRMIDRRASVADVGCDHGKLSAYLALNGASRVIAVDISAKSLSKTKQLVRELGLQHTVQTRVSDGLKKLKPGEAEVIVMAGLGGPAMCTILENGYAVASSAARLVLQPMNAVGAVRRWLTDNGFCIVEEQLAEEENRFYQILAAVPGSDGYPPMSLFDLEVGHLLIDRRHPLLPKLLQYKISTIDDILAEIAGNSTPKAEARRSELMGLRERCEEVYEWLAQ